MMVSGVAVSVTDHPPNSDGPETAGIAAFSMLQPAMTARAELRPRSRRVYGTVWF